MYEGNVVSELSEKLDRKYPLFGKNGSKVDKNFALL
jgi:hypothetical protein